MRSEVTAGNTCDAESPLDRMPVPGQPLLIDRSQFDDLDRLHVAVAASAHAIRDAGFPQEVAHELVLAAKHIRRCTRGMDKAMDEGAIEPPGRGGTKGGGFSGGKWDPELKQLRCEVTTKPVSPRGRRKP